MTTATSFSVQLLIILSLSGFLLFATVHTALAQSETTVPCEDAPFKSSAERARVKAESPDCYELRDNYSTQGVADAFPLQNIDDNSGALQQRIQLLQQILSLLQEVLRLVGLRNSL